MAGFDAEPGEYREGARFGEYKVSFFVPGEQPGLERNRFFFNDQGGVYGGLTVYSDRRLPGDWHDEIERTITMLGGEDYTENWEGHVDEESQSYLLESSRAYPLPERSSRRASGWRGRIAEFITPDLEPVHEHFSIDVYEEIAESHDVPWAESAVQFKPAVLLRYDEPYIAAAGTLESLLGVEVWHDTSSHPTVFFEGEK